MAHAFKLSAGARIFVVITVVFFLGAVSYVVLVKSATAKISPSELTGSDPLADYKPKVKSQEGQLEEFRRGLSDVKRTVKNIDTTTLDALLYQWESCVEEVKSVVETNTSAVDAVGATLEECLSLMTSTKDEFYKNIAPQKDCTETKKASTNTKRTRKTRKDK